MSIKRIRARFKRVHRELAAARTERLSPQLEDSKQLLRLIKQDPLTLRRWALWAKQEEVYCGSVSHIEFLLVRRLFRVTHGNRPDPTRAKWRKFCEQHHLPY